jgi:spore maturation protein CgeB
VNIVYSFNKRGYEAGFWEKEIAAASDDRHRLIPFNHDPYLSPHLYMRAQLLDNLYYERNPGLLQMYSALEQVLSSNNAKILIVDNCPPYHPEYLMQLPAYKVLRIADGPVSAYDRDFAYLHAYDLVLYHSPAYSRDLNMDEKLRYCGARDMHFWPLGLFDAMFDHTKTEETIMSRARDIDVVFIGALHFTKMPLMAKLTKALGNRLKVHGIGSWKRNLYYNLKYGFPGWVRPVNSQEYVPLYQRCKIGINIHNRGMYTVGNYRLFDLPGNGVMQISDGGDFLNNFFEVGEEIIGYNAFDDLIDKINYFLEHDAERERIAVNGYRRVMLDHRIQMRLRQAGELIQQRILSQG